MDRKELPPHVLMFPLPYQGPLNSTFKLAEVLCREGLHITFVVTEYIHRRLLTSTDIQTRLNCYPGFQIKPISDGLPEDHPRSGDKFMEVFDSLELKTKPLLKEMLTSGCLTSHAVSRPVTCIIADGIMGFTCDVAQEVGIPIIYFRTVSPCCLWVFFCLPDLIDSGELQIINNGDDMDTLVKSVPGTESFLRRRDLPRFSTLGDSGDRSLQHCKREGQENPRAHGLILNTFEELEGPILSHIRTLCPNLYAIGPLHARFNAEISAQTTSLLTSSSSLWLEDKRCMTWLDSKPSKSVIYVSFGSITKLTIAQLLEFWYGLASCGIHFLWVIRPDIVVGEDWESKIPTELLDASKQRGYILGWAPQAEVLTHSAIGGFLTHSGWNSTLESIHAGVPMICWPYFLDQQVNSRFVSEVWKLGLDMKDSCDRAVVEKMVRDLMVVRKEEFCERADEMAKLARTCLTEGGSSYRNFDRLVRDIQSMVS